MAFRNSKSENDIILRRSAIIDYVLKGWTQYKIAKELGISQSLVSKEMKEIQTEWKSKILDTLEEVKAREVSRLEHLIAAHWAEFEVSQWKEVYVKGKDGKITGETRKVRITGDIRYLDAILEVWKQLAKVYGIGQDVTVHNTQNNLNVATPQFPWELLYGRKEIPADEDPIEKAINDGLTPALEEKDLTSGTPSNTSSTSIETREETKTIEGESTKDRSLGENLGALNGDGEE